ncbi:hypothetical protein SmJEL517_g02472 [Synchytrium microbalum]|uniref:C3H1-type domain-containing protein n=1 Tax=Synchytrium microbalum TaxID=1806994 RepID=A0A507CAX4_9FUNG|nr:uncharacterized protein SmJEL517_g02472 [Synchytrium microbalum]TPX35104.1 hypothetical protein SmJEL517_g02472 [Synchytrium microbalum]
MLAQDRLWESDTEGRSRNLVEKRSSAFINSAQNEAPGTFGRTNIENLKSQLVSPSSGKASFEDLSALFLPSSTRNSFTSRAANSTRTLGLPPSPPPPTPLEPIFSHLSPLTSSSTVGALGFLNPHLSDQAPQAAPAAERAVYSSHNLSSNNSHHHHHSHQSTSSHHHEQTHKGTSIPLRISTSFDRSTLPKFLEARRARRGLPPTPTDALLDLELDWLPSMADIAEEGSHIGLARRSSLMSPSTLSARTLSAIDGEMGLGMRRSSSGPIISSTILNSATSSSSPPPPQQQQQQQDMNSDSTSPTTSNDTDSSSMPSPPNFNRTSQTSIVPPQKVNANLNNQISTKPPTVNTQQQAPSSIVSASAPPTPAALSVPQLQFSPVGSNTGAGSLWVLSFVNSISAPATPMEPGVPPPPPTPAVSSAAMQSPGLQTPQPQSSTNSTTSTNTGISAPPLAPIIDSAYGSTSSLMKNSDEVLNLNVDEALSIALQSVALPRQDSMGRRDSLSMSMNSLEEASRMSNGRSLSEHAIDAYDLAKYPTQQQVTQPGNMTPIEIMYQQLLAAQSPMTSMYSSAPRFPAPLCRHFLAGRCWAQSHCRFSHSIGPAPVPQNHVVVRPLCKHHLVNRLMLGRKLM